jgi:hypothetical protein
MIAQDMEPQAVQAAIREGGIVRCRICQSAILLVCSGRRGPDAQQKRSGLPPGLYCSADRNHYEVRFHMMMPNGYWDQFQTKSPSKETDGPCVDE